MISAFNLLETTFKEAIASMVVSLNRDAALAISRERRNFVPLTEIVQALFSIHVKGERERKAFKDLCNRARGLNDQRNALVHSFWAVSRESPEGDLAYRWKDDNKKTGADAWVKISAADLKQLTKSMWITAREIEIWMDRVVEPLIEIEVEKRLKDQGQGKRPELQSTTSGTLTEQKSSK